MIPDWQTDSVYFSSSLGLPVQPDVIERLLTELARDCVRLARWR